MSTDPNATSATEPAKSSKPKRAPKNAATPNSAKSVKAKPARTAAGRLDVAKIAEAATTLKMVSDSTRVVVLLSLRGGPLNVTQLCEATSTQSQPALSHHLALLRHGRLVIPTRQGKNNNYALTDAGRELAELVSKLAV